MFYVVALIRIVCRFVGFDGPTLLELQYIRQEAPDSFFTYFNKEGVCILDQTRLSRALRDLT